MQQRMKKFTHMSPSCFNSKTFSRDFHLNEEIDYKSPLAGNENPADVQIREIGATNLSIMVAMVL